MLYVYMYVAGVPSTEASFLLHVTSHIETAAVQIAPFRGVLIGADILFGKPSNYK